MPDSAPPKRCIECHREYSRGPKESYISFDARRYCSRACIDAWRKRRQAHPCIGRSHGDNNPPMLKEQP